MFINLLKKISELDPSFDEENSYFFLRDYISFFNWNIYSTKNYPFEIIEHITKLFTDAHGQISLNDLAQTSNSIWSSTPLGVFRYRMDENNFWRNIGYLNKIKGYIVEGAYWNNGFFYHVLDDTKVLEISLYINDSTMIRYNYPYTPHKALE